MKLFSEKFVFKTRKNDQAYLKVNDFLRHLLEPPFTLSLSIAQPQQRHFSEEVTHVKSIIPFFSLSLLLGFTDFINTSFPLYVDYLLSLSFTESHK